MTTDTKLKVSQGAIATADGEIRIFGTCKGAGMIGPQLGPPHATMLVYLFTDLAVEAVDARALMAACGRT